MSSAGTIGRLCSRLGDYQRWRETLAEFKDLYGVEVYAQCLMTDHVPLLLAPGLKVAAIGRLMTQRAGRQTPHHNRLEGRTGTLQRRNLNLSV